MTTLRETDPAALARAWVAVDPDPDNRRAIEELLGDLPALRARFGDRLAFGTAGLRGEVGAGPLRMNEVLVRVVAAALAARVEHEPDPHVVVGYDARHKSDVFARDTARVLAARGVASTLLPAPLPTPVLAFAVRHLDAAAGVMVTASHNPRADNGYKVYWRGGAQISPPIDAEISALIDDTPLLGDSDLASLDDALITKAGDEIVQAYLAAVSSVLDPDGPRSAVVAYTPLHGVGRGTLMRAFEANGFGSPVAVASQAEPDADFPTTPFPNPEETGVLDPLFELASEIGATVALANDPDADRLAVAVPNGPLWRLLTGDELGCLLAEHLLSGRPAADPPLLVLNTVVSSRLLGEIAAHHGAEYVETLTGFKWIMKARAERPGQQFVIGYEEALGYAIGDTVQDKDGVSAALVVAELASGLADQGRTMLDLLDDIHRRHGVYATGQRSIRFEPSDDDVPTMARAMESARHTPPATLDGRPVRRTVDLEQGSATLPGTDAVIFELDGGRVVARPSGTEPKMKVYGEVTEPVGSDITESRTAARRAVTGLLDAAVARLTAPEHSAVAALHAEHSALTVESGAAALTDELPTGEHRARDLRLIVKALELSCADGSDTPGRVRATAAQARRPDPADPTVGPGAAVAVYPTLVPLACRLTGGGVRVTALAGAFPHAACSLDSRVGEIAEAVLAGADEVTIALNRAAFLAGRFDLVGSELAAARDAAGNTHLRVVIEAPQLGADAAVMHATGLAIGAGADSVQAATGSAGTATTPQSVLAMATAIRAHARETGHHVGISVAGDTGTADEALRHITIVRDVLGDEWLAPARLRLGGPGLLADVLGELVATESRLR